METNKKQLSPEQIKRFRTHLFRFLDGFAICTTVAALNRKNVFDYILKNKSFVLKDCASRISANLGSINVGLRLLCSQGWLERKVMESGDIEYSVTTTGEEMMGFAAWYDQASALFPQFTDLRHKLQSADKMSSLHKVSQFVDKVLASKSIAENEIVRSHLLGCVVSPIFVAMGMNKKICFTHDGNFHPQNSFSGNISVYSEILNVLEKFELITNSTQPQWTLIGNFLWKRATAFGVTVSYLPLFCHVNNLIFGNPKIIWDKNSDGSESHVDRTMNVWGSGGAHSMYFKRIDKIILSIFNNPLESQPEGIADMGCGNGQFLEHLYNLIQTQTLRGQHLVEFPLKIIGADYNESALVATQKTLTNAGIDHFLIQADISKPDDFATQLRSNHVNLAKCLNVRSFLDHNRKLEPENIVEKFNEEKNIPGAFSSFGLQVPGINVFRDLVIHFKNWRPYIENYGLICLELHTIPTEWSAMTLGSQAATAYDATHGYSDQYILDYHSFKDAVKDSGLTIHPKFNWYFPSTQHPAISINYIR